MRWNPIETISKNGQPVFIIFEDGEIFLAIYGGKPTLNHNDWWTLNGLDFAYGTDNPIGWLPRETLPPIPMKLST